MARSFRAKFAALVAWQLLLLPALMAPRWTVLAMGTTVVLRTVPVDPRELFRGEYVALRYEVSSLDLNQLDWREARVPLQHDDAVFVLLAPPSADVRQPWQAVALLDRPPTQEEELLAGYGGNAVFLRGTVNYRQRNMVDIDYGIESYFVPEGEGRKLERSAGKGLTVEVKVDAHGRAAIHRLLQDGRPMQR